MAVDDPASPVEPTFILRERHSVALFDEGDEGHNVIVAGGIDVVVPVELDLDGDPLHDDAVSLRSAHGLYEHVLEVGDPDVAADPERRLAFYRFRYVPPGLYRVAARIGERWVQLGSQLSVQKDGAYWGTTRLDAAPPARSAAESDPRTDLPPIGADVEEGGPCCDGHGDPHG
ncbi:MAG: hypothetical protein AB7S26_04990 [Sandaracinaceae bacterium]